MESDAYSRLAFGCEGLATERFDSSWQSNGKAASLRPVSESQFVRNTLPSRLVTGDPGPFYREALALLVELNGQGRLTKQQVGWIDSIKGKLAALLVKAP